MQVNWQLKNGIDFCQTMKQKNPVSYKVFHGYNEGTLVWS